MHVLMMDDLPLSTVRELKEAIRDLPDDMHVKADAAYGYYFHARGIIIRDNNGTPSLLIFPEEPF